MVCHNASLSIDSSDLQEQAPGLWTRIELHPDEPDFRVLENVEGRPLTLAGSNLAEMLEALAVAHEEFWTSTRKFTRAPEFLPDAEEAFAERLDLEPLDAERISVNGRAVELRASNDNEMRINEALWKLWAHGCLQSPDADPERAIESGRFPMREARLDQVHRVEGRKRGQEQARSEMTADVVERMRRKHPGT